MGNLCCCCPSRSTPMEANRPVGQQEGALGESNLQHEAARGGQQEGALGKSNVQDDAALGGQQEGVLGESNLQHDGALGELNLQHDGALGESNLQQDAALGQQADIGTLEQQQQGGNIDELNKMIHEVNQLFRFKKLSLLEGAGTSTISATPRLSDKLNKHMQDVATWSREFDQTLATPATEVAQRDFIKSIMSKELVKPLQYFGSLHWACVGLAFIAFAINQVDQKNKNHQQCLDLLKRLLRLWEIAIQRFKDTPPKNDVDELVKKYIDHAIEVVAECVLFCAQFFRESGFTRFIFADSHKNRLNELKEKVKDAREDIRDILIVNLNPKAHQQPRAIKKRSNIFTVGLPQKTKKVLELLRLDERDTIRAVVLHGIGGVGKSTLADSVYDDEIRWRGGLACSCIRLKQGFIATDLHKQMITDLNICELRAENYSNVKEELWQSISRLDQPVFIYIDNILEVKDLEDLLPAFMEQIKLPKGSRLMLTTRDLNACHRVLGRNKTIVIDKYQVPCLSLEEGKELMKACAFGIPSKDFIDHEGANEKEISEDLIEKIVETCDRLPLAITILGKQLYGADEIEWKGVLERLQCSKTNLSVHKDQVFTVLQYSYDALDVDCRKAFVFVSSCLEAFAKGVSWRFLNNIVESLCSGIQLKQLVNYALVEPEQYLLQDTQKYHLTVKMQNLLMALGHQIAEKENIISKIVRKETSSQEMDMTSWCDVQWLIVRDIEGGFPASLLDKCERLELLLIFGSLVGRPKKLPTHLKVLHLASTKEEDIPWKLESLENLVYFGTELGCSAFPVRSDQIRIFHGFQNERFPDKLACNRLQKLFCNSIPTSVSTDFLERITCLRSLMLHGEFVSLPQNFGCLRNLHALEIKSQNLREFPQSLVELSHLRMFRLFSRELQQLPEGFGSGLKALSYFYVKSEHMTTLPEDLGNLKRLQYLNMRLPMLKAVPPTLSQLSNLLNFTLESCSPLTKLTGLEGKLLSLESLNLFFHSTNLSLDSTVIPTTLVPSLKKLKLWNFYLVSLPIGIGKLVSLKVLHICGAPLLQTLPNELISLISLEVLVLENCPKLATLQEGHQSSNEEAHDNIKSDNMSSLPSSLNSLIVANCPNLQPHSINSLPQGLIQIYDVLPQSLVCFLLNTFYHPNLDMLLETLL